MTQPLWLPSDVVIKINRDVVSGTGEPFFLRDRERLESAVAKPKQHYWYGGELDALNLACVLLFGIARNHPFEQGNKRTALLSAVLFLEQNGYTLDLPNTDLLGKQITLVLEGGSDDSDFIKFVRPFVVECPV